MDYTLARTEEEIDELLNECSDQIEKGGSKFPGMTYEEGIENALRWVIDGGWKVHPLED